MISKEAEELHDKGLEALDHDHDYLARTCFEQAATLERTPENLSCLALCLAKTRKQPTEAIGMAREALAADPANPLLHLNLGKIYWLAGEKEKALETLRNGMQYDTGNMISHELTRYGKRRPPLFPSLKRSHPLNRYLGLLLSRLGLR
ncbi:tetratricopeptide repeat protein [Geotalea sp. SG265]|uniref:tetratricopeptide repeat protein n=1 Tax=Geotalea sp. SG265 TaxID=2922867 RepID=UPI001FAF0F1F|nr:tetratricopeptide repeat protein [Geotalea sp. SG265]